MLGDITPYPGVAVLHGPAPQRLPKRYQHVLRNGLSIEPTCRLFDVPGEIAMKTQSDCISRPPRKAVSRALLVGAWVVAGMLSTAAMADTDQDESEQHNGSVVRTAEGPVQGIVKIEASTHTPV